MSIQKIGASYNLPKSVAFRADNSSKKGEYENPVSRQTEKNLAILNCSAGAGVAGLIVGGLTNFAVKNRSTAIIAGVVAAGVYLGVTLPSAMYNRKVSAFVKQKEMDVFTRDRDLKSNLTEDVDHEVQDKNVSLDKKLDDNLKLQMANRGAAIGLANMTPQN